MGSCGDPGGFETPDSLGVSTVGKLAHANVGAWAAAIDDARRLMQASPLLQLERVAPSASHSPDRASAHQVWALKCAENNESRSIRKQQ